MLLLVRSLFSTVVMFASSRSTNFFGSVTDLVPYWSFLVSFFALLFFK